MVEMPPPTDALSTPVDEAGPFGTVVSPITEAISESEKLLLVNPGYCIFLRYGFRAFGS